MIINTFNLLSTLTLFSFCHCFNIIVKTGISESIILTRFTRVSNAIVSVAFLLFL